MSWIYREKYDISDVTHPLTSIEVERMLSRIKLSASGCDDIPVWLLHQCTYELADIVAHIVNCSVFSGTVPSYWLNASVPKVPKPTGLSDFRPIGLSVTPLISRLTEKIIVRRWILPSVPPAVLGSRRRPNLQVIIIFFFFVFIFTADNPQLLQQAATQDSI